MAVDAKKLEQFLGQFVTDLGATVHAGMVVIGDRLGLYKALAAGPLSAPELSAITRTDERYVREWLASQAAGAYITYDPQTHKFGMTEEQALTLANEDGPAYLPGAFELALGSLAAVPRITVRATTRARLMFLGGTAMEGPRYIWWNFVSSRRERIEQAKEEWKSGRFAPVPGETEFIPLPER